MAGLNIKEAEEKWQRRWKESKIFDAEIAEQKGGKKKFFLTVPYPYTSGPLHIGHGRTNTIGDIIARFKRLQGYNVLFPMAFHVTGTPILAIADSIAKGDQEVVARYKEYVSIYEDASKVDGIISSFSRAERVADFFAERISEDFERMGYSIDWRRKFNTTEPMYNKFIEWQFKKLYDKGVIKKGSYPITYSIEDNSPVGEDDIEEGDTNKVTIIEHTTIKFGVSDDTYLIAATLRPETVFGVTNLWIKPTAKYVKVAVGGEYWIVSREAALKLGYQREAVEGSEEIEGSYFVGKNVKEPMKGREIPVLSAGFVDPDVGTGVVYSVPAHAPYDYIALEDVRKKEGIEIEPIKVIDIEGYELPAKEICEKMGIANQEDERLEEATQIIYKDEFYRGVLNEQCGDFAGIKIAAIKDEVKDWLKGKNIADVFYETSRKAVTRGGGKVIVAVLQDQWFIDYTPKWWKDLGHELVEGMTFYPEKYKAYMHDIIDWLALRPCARKRGLGTRFPFEKEWIIESLSDSTIYMALYTIAHRLRQLPVDCLDEKFFDYVFLGIGSGADELAKESHIEADVLNEIKEEFEYWYPNDLRHTAPPHLSNHLVFFLMHHAAIFPPTRWPRAITLNELMIREGQKMSKSKGNVIPLAKVSELYGVDLFRLYCAINADFASVINWREQDVDALKKRFNALVAVFKESTGVDVAELKEDEFTHTGRWLLSRFYRRLKESIKLFDAFRIREAGINLVFNLLNDIRYYERRESPEKRRRIIRNVIEDWLLILSPIVPHICEEEWHKLHHSFISLQSLPELKEAFIDDRVERKEEYLVSLIADIKEILKIARIEPTKIYVYTADADTENWKWEVFRAIKDLPERDKIKEAMKLRKDKSTVDFVKRVIKSNLDYFELNEREILEREKAYLTKEFGCEIGINEEHDPKGKSKFAIPLKPAIYVEG
uniref:Leucine--tRNA ligase n=1 Tax=Candidatus Methanophagaceae archaeon ANME-1 ERB6 TaxID=2759912 RepID=A0A7G9YT92_9EURY|nr:leucine--tRNA ligase [Methanosarcinales archaeon ANME-1 ERB6]